MMNFFMASLLLQFAIDQHERAAGVRSAIICPGFVDTDVAPAFFRLFRPLLMHLRCVIPVLLSCVAPSHGCMLLSDW